MSSNWSNIKNSINKPGKIKMQYLIFDAIPMQTHTTNATKQITVKTKQVICGSVTIDFNRFFITLK